MAQPRAEKAFVSLGKVNGKSFSDAFAGTSTAADILRTPASNAAKTLKKHGVERQTLRLGNREMAVYARADVVRLKRKLDADEKRVAANAKRRVAAQANAARRKAPAATTGKRRRAA